MEVETQAKNKEEELKAIISQLMEEKGVAETNVKKLEEDFERLKVSDENLRVENQQLSEVNSVLCIYIFFTIFE